MDMQRCPPERVASLVPEGLAGFATEMLTAHEAIHAAAAGVSTPAVGGKRGRG